jgi:hypothetical protein
MSEPQRKGNPLVGSDAEALAFKKPDPEMARLHELEVALPRRVRMKDGSSRLLGTLEKFEGGEVGELFPLWSSSWRDFGGFGVGIPLYFLTLKVFALICLLGFVLLVPNMVYYSGDYKEFGAGSELLPSRMPDGNYDALLSSYKNVSKQEVLNFILKGSAVCEHQLVNASCNGGYDMKQFKQCSLDISIGLWDLLCVGIMLLCVILYFRHEHVVARTLSQRGSGATTSGYSVVVRNPPPHENDPDVWKAYFEKVGKGPVAFVTVVKKSSELLNKLRHDWDLDREIQMKNEKVRIATQSDGLKREKHSIFYYLCIPVILLVDCLTCVVCAESAGGAEAVGGAAESRHHGRKSWVTRHLPYCIRMPLQRIGIGRDIVYWTRRSAQQRHHIQKLLHSPRLQRVDRVYVTYETEATQRRCLRRLTDGFLCTYFNLPCKVPRGFRFVDTNGKRHELRVEVPMEPVAIIWHHLHYGSIWRYFVRGATFVGTILIAAIFAGIIYLLSAYGNTFVAAVFVSIANSITPFFVILISNREMHISFDELEASLFWKMLVVRVTNSAIIAYLRAAVFTSYTNTNTADTLWAMYQILLVDAFLTPVLRALNLPARMKKAFIAPHAKNQLALVSYYSGTKWHLGERYTDLINTLFTSFFYMTLMPQGLLISAISFSTQYCADKYLLLRHWRSNFYRYNESVSRQSHLPIFMCFFVHLVIASHFFGSWPFDEVCPTNNQMGFECCDKSIDSFYPTAAHVENMTDAQYYLVRLFVGLAALLGVLLLLMYYGKWLYRGIRYSVCGWHKSVEHAESRPVMLFSGGDPLNVLKKNAAGGAPIAGSQRQLTGHEEKDDEKDEAPAEGAEQKTGKAAKTLKAHKKAKKAKEGKESKGDGVAFSEHDEHYNKTNAGISGNKLGLQAYIPTIYVRGGWPVLACNVEGVTDRSFTLTREVTGDFKWKAKLKVHKQVSERNTAHAHLHRTTTDEASRQQLLDNLGPVLSVCKQYPIDRARLQTLPEVRSLPMMREGGAEDPRRSEFKSEEGRRCTDVLWLVFFVMFWLGLGFMIHYSVYHGRPERLLFATNFEGDLCGEGELRHKQLIYYPNLQQDLVKAYTDPAAIGKYNPLNGGDPTQIVFHGVCISRCPTMEDAVDTATGDFCDATTTTKTTHTKPDSTVVTGECKQAQFDTQNVLYRCLYFSNITRQHWVECMEPEVSPTYACGGYNCEMSLYDQTWTNIARSDPSNSSSPMVTKTTKGAQCTKARVKTLTTTEQPSKSDPLFDSLSTAAATLQRWWGDLLQSSGTVILCGGVLALVISMIWLVLMEHMAKTMVWATIWFLYIILMVLTIYLYWEAGMVDLQQFGAFRTSSAAFLQDSGLSSAYKSGASAASVGRSAAADTPVVRHLLTSSIEDVWEAPTAPLTNEYGKDVLRSMRVLREEYEAHEHGPGTRGQRVPTPLQYTSARSLTEEEDSASSLSRGAGLSEDVATLGNEYQKVFKFAAYGCTALTCIVGLAIIWLRSRIGIAIGIIREASRAIRSMPMLLLFPILPNVLYIAMTAGWLYVSASLGSLFHREDDPLATLTSTYSAESGYARTGDLSATALNATVAKFSADQAMLGMQLYVLFGYLWTTRLLHACITMTIAGAVSEWYWCHGNTRREEMHNIHTPIFNSLSRAVRFHLGKHGQVCASSPLLTTFLPSCRHDGLRLVPALVHPHDPLGHALRRPPYQDSAAEKLPRAHGDVHLEVLPALPREMRSVREPHGLSDGRHSRYRLLRVGYVCSGAPQEAHPQGRHRARHCIFPAPARQDWSCGQLHLRDVPAPHRFQGRTFRLRARSTAWCILSAAADDRHHHHCALCGMLLLLGIRDVNRHHPALILRRPRAE